MKETRSVQKFWDEVCRANSKIDSKNTYQIWHFGNSPEMARKLCDLVLKGKKTATASLVWEYETDSKNSPILNGYSVVTDFYGHPQCLVQTTELKILPFDSVDAKFAFDEGEGDRSLECWRKVHWDYFSCECAKIGKEPTTEMLVICERFELIYSKK